jgi:hypothetical protein
VRAKTGRILRGGLFFSQRLPVIELAITKRHFAMLEIQANSPSFARGCRVAGLAFSRSRIMCFAQNSRGFAPKMRFPVFYAQNSAGKARNRRGKPPVTAEFCAAECKTQVQKEFRFRRCRRPLRLLPLTPAPLTPDACMPISRVANGT